MSLAAGLPTEGGPSRGRTLLLALPLAALALAVLALSASAAGTVVGTDTVIHGAQVWANGTFEVDANVTVASGGTLVVSNATIAFRTPVEGGAGIEVGSGGTLRADGVAFSALDAPYYLSVLGRVELANCTLSGLMSTPSTQYIYFDMLGGIVLDNATASFVNVSIGGESDAMLTCFDSNITAAGLRLEGPELGMVLINTDAAITDLSLDGFYLGVGVNGSRISVSGARALRCNSTLWAVDSVINLTGLFSNASEDHVGAWSSNLSIHESTFQGGATGVLTADGSVDIRGCTFNDTLTAVEIAYSHGAIVGCTVRRCMSIAFSLSALDRGAERPDFTFDRNTVIDCRQTGIYITDCGEVWLTNLTLGLCGDGISASGSTVHLVDSSIDRTSIRDALDLSSTSTGTGVWLETTIFYMGNTTVSRSGGPGVVAYYSDVHAVGSRVTDGNASGFLVIYGGLELRGCTVSGNHLYGADVSGYPISLQSQDAVWGNGKPDVRYNTTVTAKVVDSDGLTLSKANVTASSRGTTVGPFSTGFVGTTSLIEMTMFEFTYPASNVSYSPWAFTVTYGPFTNTTSIDLDVAVSDVTLVVGVLRPDLVVEGLKAPKQLRVDTKTVLHATVRNVGHYKAEGVLLTLYYRNSAGFTRVIGEVSLGTLEVGAPRDASMNWTMSAIGDYTVVASADVDNQVNEEAEGNNTMEAPVKVVMKAQGGIPDTGALLAVAAIAAVSAAVVWTSRRGTQGQA